MSAVVESHPILHVADVEFVRNGRHLLSSMSMTVRAGEHWAIVGPNGAGKSTLLSLLGAVNHPTNGSVDVLGHRLGRVDLRSLRAMIGHVDPRHRLDQPLSAVDVVLTGLTSTSVLPPRTVVTTTQRERAHELLAMLGMDTRLHTVWPTMSQGERGRVLIARAMISHPRLLLLDEPATGLDVAAREQLLAAMDEIARSELDVSSITVTHHLEDLPATTSHVLMLRDGRVVASGPTAEVLNNENISACFRYRLAVSCVQGRWLVRSR